MKISIDERKSLHQLCFQDSDVYTDGFFERFYKPSDTTDLVRDGKLVATLYVKKHALCFGQQVLPYDFITGLCVHPDYRKQGCATALLDKYFLKSDAAFAALHPFDRGFYYKQGFVPYSFASADTAKATNAQIVPKPISEPKQIVSAVESVMKRRLQNSFPFVPVLKSAGGLIAEIELELLDGAEFYALTAGARIVGFAVVNDAEILSYELLDRRNINDVAEFKNLRFYQSPLSNTVFNLARAADVEKLLYGILYAAEHRVKFDFNITDSRTPRNNGTYRIVIAHHKCVAILRMPEKPWLPTLSAEQLTLLALGQPNATDAPAELQQLFLTYRIEDRSQY